MQTVLHLKIIKEVTGDSTEALLYYKRILNRILHDISHMVFNIKKFIIYCAFRNFSITHTLNIICLIYSAN